MFVLQKALIFLISSIFSVYIFIVWLRIYLQFMGANFFNPICQFLIIATNPFVLPLRKILPSLKSIDLSSTVLLFATAIIEIFVLGLIAGYLINFFFILFFAVLTIVNTILQVFFWGVILRAIFSFLPQSQYSPTNEILFYISEPLLKPARRMLPPISGIDLSPFIVLLFLGFIKIIISGYLFPL